MPSATPSKLLILVGTVTHTAASVARTIEMDCTDLIGTIEVRMMDGLDPSVFDEDALYVICASTHGAGDVPDNAQAFYASLDAQPRYLGHVRFGIKTIGLTNVAIALHPEVVATVTLNIARSADEAERQARGETLDSAEAIYGEEINESARPEAFFDPEAEIEQEEGEENA